MAIVAFSFESNAQAQKFGHINTDELLRVMPEIDSMQSKLQAYGQDLASILEEVQVEINKKEDEFSKNQETWSDVVKESKYRDILDQRRRLQEQQAEMQTKYNSEQQRLFAPIQEKVNKTIEKVAKANNLIYVFDIAAGNPIYFNESLSTDILPMVKKELGITK